MDLRLGRTIVHPKFGRGIITAAIYAAAPSHPPEKIRVTFGGPIGGKLFSVPVLSAILDRGTAAEGCPERPARRPRRAGAHAQSHYRPTRTTDAIIRDAYRLAARGRRGAIAAAARCIGWPRTAVARRAAELGERTRTTE